MRGVRKLFLNGFVQRRFGPKFALPLVESSWISLGQHQRPYSVWLTAEREVCMRAFEIAVVLSILSMFFCIPLAAQTNPVPFISNPLVPSVAAPGGPGFTLTVNGAGFVSGSAVKWNGSARTTTFVSPTKLTAAILASDIATSRTVLVTVSNPPPGGGTSDAVFF